MSAPGDLGVSGVGQGVGHYVATLDQGDPQAPFFQLSGAEDTYDAGANDRHVEQAGPGLPQIRFVYQHNSSCRSVLFPKNSIRPRIRVVGANDPEQILFFELEVWREETLVA